MKRRLSLIWLFLWLSAAAVPAATIINWHNTQGTELRNLQGDPLTHGVPGRNYSGAIIQLGYYTFATTESPFVGEWISISGDLLTIGEKGHGSNQPGRFHYTGGLGSNFIRPAAGTPLSIRFYDATSLEAAAYFNAVTGAAGAWNWMEASEGNVIIDAVLEQGADLVWEGGADSAFRTTIPMPAVPEPSGLLLAAATILGLSRRR